MVTFHETLTAWMVELRKVTGDDLASIGFDLSTDLRLRVTFTWECDGQSDFRECILQKPEISQANPDAHIDHQMREELRKIELSRQRSEADRP